MLLDKALYGHPDSGTYWEEHCDKHCQSVGFVPITNWPSCYYMKRLDLFLVIYVDDFKLAGPAQNLAEGWRLIRGNATAEGGEGLIMEDPTPLGQYLGCNHIQGNIVLPNGNKARTIEYDMEDFFDSCVSRYVDLATGIQGSASKLGVVGTPFLEDSPGGFPSRSACARSDTPAVFCPWCNNHFPIAGNQEDPNAKLREQERKRLKKAKEAMKPHGDADPAFQVGAATGDEVSYLNENPTQ